MKHHEAKWRYLYARQHFKCAILAANAPLLCGPKYPPVELHHTHCHNTRNNRKQFPLFIDSVWNLVLVSEYGHARFRSWGRWSYERCARVEAFLRRHPMIAEWVNSPDIAKLPWGD